MRCSHLLNVLLLLAVLAMPACGKQDGKTSTEKMTITVYVPKSSASLALSGENSVSFQSYVPNDATGRYEPGEVISVPIAAEAVKGFYQVKTELDPDLAYVIYNGASEPEADYRALLERLGVAPTGDSRETALGTGAVVAAFMAALDVNFVQAAMPELSAMTHDQFVAAKAEMGAYVAERLKQLAVLSKDVRAELALGTLLDHGTIAAKIDSGESALIGTLIAANNSEAIFAAKEKFALGDSTGFAKIENPDEAIAELKAKAPASLYATMMAGAAVARALHESVAAGSTPPDIGQFNDAAKTISATVLAAFGQGDAAGAAMVAGLRPQPGAHGRNLTPEQLKALAEAAAAEAGVSSNEIAAQVTAISHSNPIFAPPPHISTSGSSHGAGG